MSTIAKATTLLRLLARRDWQTLRGRWQHHTAPGRARRHGGRAFAHRDLGFASVCHPDWPDSLAQFLNGAGDHWEMSLLRRWLQPGDAAVDIGCNLGLYSFAMADRVGAGGAVLAVDADALIIEKLRAAATLLRAPQLQPVQAAVTDQSGSVTFHVRADRSVTTEQSLLPDDQLKAGCVAVTVPALTLAEVVRQLPRPDTTAVIKMDIEGAEAMAFKAVPPALLTADGPFWLVEIHPGALARFGATPTDIVGRFPRTGFELWLLSKHPLEADANVRTLRPLTEGEAFTDSIYYNLLAVPRGPARRKRRLAVRQYLPLTE